MKTGTIYLRTTLLLLSLMLIHLGSWAQLDDNSKAIIKGVAQKTKTYKTIKIGFIFKSTQKGKAVTQNGYIWIKGNKFLFNFNKQTIMSNGVTQWTYIQEANEVTINKADADQESINPASILNDYEKKYRTKLIKEASEKGKVVQIVDLYPLKASSVASIRLTIQKNIQQITKMMVVEKNSNIYEYIVSTFVVNQPILDSVFEFNAKKYPNVEVIDMR